jgi:hypothetical protein
MKVDVLGAGLRLALSGLAGAVVISPAIPENDTGPPDAKLGQAEVKQLRTRTRA